MPQTGPDYSPDRAHRCAGNLKTCPESRGGCGYRYKKTDTKWQDGGKCPKCGFDRRCNANRVVGYRVCTNHGAGHPHKGKYPGRPPKNGRRPQQLVDRILERENDPNLLEMRFEISALRERLEQLLDKVDSGQSSAAWKKLQTALPAHFDQLESLWTIYGRAMTALKQDQTPENRQRAQEALHGLGDYLTDRSTRHDILNTVDEGTNASLSWDEFADYADRLRRLKDSQRKWELDKRYYITVTEAMALPTAIYNIITERVKDPDTMKWLLAGLEEEIMNFQKQSPKVIEG